MAGKQHPNVKTLREVRRGANFTMLPDEIDALDWAIRVCEAADNLVNVKGRHHTETAYRRLDDAVNASENGE